MSLMHNDRDIPFWRSSFLLWTSKSAWTKVSDLIVDDLHRDGTERTCLVNHSTIGAWQFRVNETITSNSVGISQDPRALIDSLSSTTSWREISGIPMPWQSVTHHHNFLSVSAIAVQNAMHKRPLTCLTCPLDRPLRCSIPIAWSSLCM